MADDNVSVKGLFQSLIPDQLSIFQAKVIDTDELRIVSCNNDKLVISADSLMIPDHLKLHTEIHNGESVVVDSSLKEGDIIYVLTVSRQGVFFIMGRS